MLQSTPNVGDGVPCFHNDLIFECKPNYKLLFVNEKRAAVAIHGMSRLHSTHILKTLLVWPPSTSVTATPPHFIVTPTWCPLPKDRPSNNLAYSLLKPPPSIYLRNSGTQVVQNTMSQKDFFQHRRSQAPPGITWEDSCNLDVSYPKSRCKPTLASRHSCVEQIQLN